MKHYIYIENNEIKAISDEPIYARSGESYDKEMIVDDPNAVWVSFDFIDGNPVGITLEEVTRRAMAGEIPDYDPIV